MTCPDEAILFTPWPPDPVGLFVAAIVVGEDATRLEIVIDDGSLPAAELMAREDAARVELVIDDGGLLTTKPLGTFVTIVLASDSKGIGWLGDTIGVPGVVGPLASVTTVNET